jgi:hypothetical protein
MLGCCRPEMALASRSKRKRRSEFEVKWEGRTLTATVRSRRVSKARYTSPIPPAPSGPTISYGPSFVPGGSVMSARIIALEQPREVSSNRLTPPRSPLLGSLMGADTGRITSHSSGRFVTGSQSCRSRKRVSIVSRELLHAFAGKLVAYVKLFPRLLTSRGRLDEKFSP